MRRHAASQGDIARHPPERTHNPSVGGSIPPGPTGLPALPIGERASVSFTTGLLPSAKRPFQLHVLAPQTDGLTDPDDAPEPQAAVVSALGDAWLLGRHRLVCGDCTDPETVSKALNGVSPHLMVTDPDTGLTIVRLEVQIVDDRGKEIVGLNLRQSCRANLGHSRGFVECKIARPPRLLKFFTETFDCHNGGL